MRPRISLITLAVADLERSIAFYRDGLGLPTRGIMGTEFEIGAVAARLHALYASIAPPLPPGAALAQSASSAS